MKRSHWILALLAIVGLGVTVVAVARWSPDSVVRLPRPRQVLERASADAREIGYTVQSRPEIQVSAGPREHVPMRPFLSLVQEEPDRRRRLQRIREAPPTRLAARFATATSDRGAVGDLVLEYDGSGRLVGASFAMDDLLARGPTVAAEMSFADRLAEKILGAPPPPRPQDSGLQRESIYRVEAEGPAVYVFLGADGSWTAQLQPAPDFLVTTQSAPLLSRPPSEQVRFYALGGLALLALAVLIWRFTRRRAGLGEARGPAVLLAIGLLPVLGSFQATPSLVVALVLFFVFPQVAVLLGWVVGEAEIREARPQSLAHSDRLLRQRPIQETGFQLLVGLGFGCMLSGLVAASGELASLMGGGYGSPLLILPDYWTLPSPLNRGVALVAATAFLVGLGARIAGIRGVVVGGAVAGLGWSLVMPVAPEGVALTFGVAAGLLAAWVLWQHGLLELTVATVTGLSLPMALVVWGLMPHLTLVALVASLPLLLLPVAMLLVGRAPEHDSREALQPTYVRERESEARLEEEVDLLRELQLSLLPGPSQKEWPHVDIAWRMIPADAVGGDYLDLLEDDSGRLWIVVADAAGHGISCSILTTFTKAWVLQHAVAGIGPAEALSGIRSLFARLGTPRSLVTLLLAVLDPKSRSLRVACAGHPPLLLCDDEGAREIGQFGRPLGVDLPGEDSEETVLCSSGTVLVAFTDGVGEASSPTDEAFGYERWPQMLPVLRSRHQPSVVVLESLLRAVSDHRAGRPAGDDVTAIVVRCID